MRIVILLMISVFLYSCSGNSDKDRVEKILKEKLGNAITFNEIKIANVEGGTGVIVDGNWCYWIDSNEKVFCVNGSSKTIFNSSNSIECEDAPIQSGFSDIEKIAK